MSLLKIKPFSLDETQSFTFANVSVTGNVTATNASLGNLVIANYFSGNGSLLSSLNGSNVTGQVGNALVAGTVYTAAQPNITSVGTLTALAVAANIVAGNVSGGNLVSANYFSGNGSLLTSLTGANVSGTVALADHANLSDVANIALTVNGANVTGYVANATHANIADVANVAYSVSGANVSGAVAFATTANAVAGANVSGTVANATFATTAGTVAGANVTGQVANALIAGTVYTNAQPNITSVGTLSSLNVTGNVTAAYFIGNGSQLTGLPAGYTDANVAAYLPTYTGNLSAGNITTTGASGNISGANWVIANYFSGSGNNLSNIQGANVTGEVAFATTANAVAGANVSGTVALATHANIADLANAVAGANVSGTVALATHANVADLANAVAGANVTGTVALATHADVADVANSVAGANVTGQVANALVAGTVYTNAQPNITSVGTLSSLAVSGSLSAGDTTIAGNLTVTGTTTSVNSTVTQIVDPIVELGGGANGAALTTNDGKERGQLLHYYDGAAKDAFMGWMNTNKEFTFASAVTVANNTVTVSSLGNIKAGDATLGNLVTSNYFSGNGSLLSSITGANVTGTVALADHANLADVANVALSVNGANVTGTVALATHANVADVANSVAGANVTGTVALAEHANVADVANVALSVNGANVSGQVANALVAGTVYTNAQPNITSVGTLSSLSVTGDVAAGNIKADHLLYANGAPYVFTTNAAGSTTQVQFNSSNSFAGSANFTFDTATNTLATTNIAISGTANLGTVANVKIAGGSANYVLKTDGTGNLSWSALSTTTMVVDTFTGDGSWTMKTLSATPASVDYTIVGIGGVLQPRSSYSVLADVITFTAPPPAGSTVEITTVTGGATGGGSGGVGYTYSAVSANVTMVKSTKYIVDSSTANITLTLPSSATLGDEISIMDGTGNASTHAITIARNGGNIQGAASDMTVTTDRAAFTLAYYNATQGWLLTNV